MHFRSLLDRGARLAFGSDWNVAPLDPVLGIYAAVTRRTLDGKHPEGWVPEQKITVEEALRAYTAGNAYAVFAEGSLGRLAPGYQADLVVLDRDLTRIPPETIDRAQHALVDHPVHGFEHEPVAAERDGGVGLLQRHPVAAPPETIDQAQVRLTVAGGRVVFERE